MKPGSACDRPPRGRARPGVESDEDAPRSEGRRPLGTCLVATEAEQKNGDDPRAEDPHPSRCGDVQDQGRPTRAVVDALATASPRTTVAIGGRNATTVADGVDVVVLPDAIEAAVEQVRTLIQPPD